ncbi:hypothetical protein V6N13_072869 [Hibiscus sabdariffa]
MESVPFVTLSCPRQPYESSVKFQYGDWLRVSKKKKLMGGSTSKDGLVANAFINELFDSEHVDHGIGGSATDVHVVDDSGNDVVVDVSVAPNGFVDVMLHQVPTATAAFVVGAIGEPTNPILAEFNEWFVGREDGVDSVRRDHHASIPVKRALSGSDPPKMKWARFNSSTVPL